ncbi:hypothetical protein NQ315_007882, partial [Exocentrus adspersus]
YTLTISWQFSVIEYLSVSLQENVSLVIPWVIGFITFMALEAVSMVYSNVLRDHVNKEFDNLCKAEVVFFATRVVINVLAISGVMRFCNLLRAGITWKGPEVIEL